MAEENKKLHKKLDEKDIEGVNGGVFKPAQPLDLDNQNNDNTGVLENAANAGQTCISLIKLM